jgi:hypothetical protein
MAPTVWSGTMLAFNREALESMLVVLHTDDES